jgi:HemX protein
VAILSYGAFSLSFVFSLLYLLQYNLLKQKKWGKRLWRITDLSKLEHLSYVLAVIGVPMLLIGVILGTQWAYLKLPNISWFDPKVIGSVFVLTVYCVYLYLRIRRGIAGKTLAMWNIAAFLILLINFFLIGNISSFHIWL